MKKITLILALLFLNIISKSQSPLFQWAKGLDAYYSIEGNTGKSVVTDASGNIYTVGEFQGTVDFDLGAGVFNLTSNTYGAYSSSNVFILKLDASGNFVWAKQMKGTGAASSKGFSIALDASGNVYTTGYFNGTVDFDPGAGSDSLTSALDCYAAFISKLDSSGNFIWAKKMGGTTSTDFALGNSITVDTANNVYTAGYFLGTVDFNPGAAVSNFICPGTGDVFISKLDASGNFLWTKQMAGSTDTESHAGSIIVDASENVYTTGYFNGTVDFDPGAGIVNLTSVSSTGNMFISKLDASGIFVWAKNIGGTTSADRSGGTDIALDAANNVYTTGGFSGTVDFDPGVGVFNLTTGFSDDIFILKLDPSGNFVWAKNMAEDWSSVSDGYSIASDATGNIYTTGYLDGTADFDPGVGVDSLRAPSGSNAFISKLDSLGNFVWAINMGDSTGILYGNSIALDPANDIYTVGYFQGTADFDPAIGVFDLTTDQNDIYIHKMSQTSMGINEYTDNNNITVYPNPTIGIFDLSISNLINNKRTDIEIYNSVGGMVYSKQIVNAQIAIDLSNQASGLYFVKVISENKIVGTKKIIKE
ncbi:MAG: T9SS type A sorting domain-containing protein [Bacteroidia bacterium]